MTGCWWVMSPTKSVAAGFSKQSTTEKQAPPGTLGQHFFLIINIIVRFLVRNEQSSNGSMLELLGMCTIRHETLTWPWKPDVVTVPRHNSSCRWCRWMTEGESGVPKAKGWVSSTIYPTYLEGWDDRRDMKINSETSLKTFSVDHVLH